MKCWFYSNYFDSSEQLHFKQIPLFSKKRVCDEDFFPQRCSVNENIFTLLLIFLFRYGFINVNNMNLSVKIMKTQKEFKFWFGCSDRENGKIFHSHSHNCWYITQIWEKMPQVMQFTHFLDSRMLEAYLQTKAWTDCSYEHVRLFDRRKMQFWFVRS